VKMSVNFDGFVLDLEGDGQGGFFRVGNRPGEVNRPVMINRGTKLQVTADLVEVMHGTLKPGGDQGTLIVADFRFLPTNWRRFKAAIVKFQFISDDPSVEVAVIDIAPHGSWSLNPTSRKDEFGGILKPEAGAGGANASLGEVSLKQTQDKNFHTKVSGSMKMETRDTGGKDTAQWTLAENPAQKTGIASTLRVAILLKRIRLAEDQKKTGEEPTFRGIVEVIADSDLFSSIEEKLERVRKKVPKDEAVVFKHGKNLSSDRFKIDDTSLGSHKLNDIMYMSLHESYEDLGKPKGDA
jgi:hypothetical protein